MKPEQNGMTDQRADHIDLVDRKDETHDPIQLLHPAEAVHLDLPADEARPAEVAQHVLRIAREHLGMDVSWIAEFAGSHLVCRMVDGDAAALGMNVGSQWWLDETERQSMLSGQISALVADTTAEDAPEWFFAPDHGGIRSYLATPIRLVGGGVYGMLCCASGFPWPGMHDDRDVQVLQVLAEIVAGQLERTRPSVDPGPDGEMVRQVLQRGGPRMAFQPIVDLRSGRMAAVEALARFPGTPYEPPDIWFDRATRAGLAVDMERLAVRRALDARHRLPAGAAMNLNVSPEFVLSGSLEEEVLDASPVRVVVELTEHATVPDYDELCSALEGLRTVGVQVAIDDAGAGFASFRHVLELEPDVIKLDRALTTRVGTDRMQDALTAALTAFAAKAGASVTAEGIEELDTLRALRVLGVDHGQGFLFARAADLPLARTEFAVV